MRSLDKSLENVTDPSDWESTKIPSMQQLDSLQRCYICKEFLQAPVVTSCNHTFCSRCIRQHLMVKNSCPLCLSTQLETNLRREVVLEEIVTCYSSLRPFLLQFLNSTDAGQDQLSEEIAHSNHKRKYDGSSSPLVTAPNSSSTTASEEPEPKKAKMDEAECPVCQKQMDSKFLQNVHIDKCLQGVSVLPSAETSKPKPKPKTEISSYFKNNSRTKRPDVNDALKIDHQDFYFNNASDHNRRENRIPKLDFSSLTLPKLKEKLASVNLPTTGTRHQLELRYNQYYILHNSNLDSNHPVDIRVLRSRLSKWESSHSAFSSGTTSTLFSTSGSNSISHRSITDKKFSVKEWKTVYHHDFKELTKQALNNVKKRSAKVEQNHERPEAEEIASSKITQTPVISNATDGEQDQLNFESSVLFVNQD